MKYPAVLPALGRPQSSVIGLPTFGITQKARESLDAYELAYTPTTVKVEIQLVGGEKRMVDADTYIWNMENSQILTEADEDEFAWSLERYRAWTRRICDYPQGRY